MGLIQIDMKMPKNCKDCPACNEYLMCAIPCNGRGWGENDVRDFSQGRPEWCPLKEQEPVKPRYIPPKSIYSWECGVCAEPFDRIANYCPNCGRAVKWDD